MLKKIPKSYDKEIEIIQLKNKNIIFLNFCSSKL